MALASQTSRQSSIRAFTRGRGGGGGGRRRRWRFLRPSRRMLAIGGMLGLIALIWWLWPAGDGATPAGGPAPAQAAGDRANQPEHPDRNRRTAAADAPKTQPTTTRKSTDPATAAKDANSAANRREVAANTAPPPAAPAPGQGAAATRPNSAGEAALTEALKINAASPEQRAAARPNPLNTSQQQTNTPASSAPPLSNRGSTESPQTVRDLIAQAEAFNGQNRPVQVRMTFNRALHDPRTSEADRALIRSRMSEISNLLTFSPTVVEGDFFSEKYAIQSGDRLSSLPERLDLSVDWRLLQRINKLKDPGRINIGQTLKMVRGPFHAVVSKSAFRMDVFAGPPPSRTAPHGYGPSTSGDLPVYIRSFNVGLGEYSSTPVGTWIVRRNSKLVNPAWTNPRTNEYFSENDPKNPIGERWIGLDGADPATESLLGYGVHGTIDPDSIGKEMSMGCVRLLAEDIELVYELLTEGVSTVRVVE